MTTPAYGLWLLLGVVLSPLYLMLAGWFFGRPRQLRLPFIGVGFIVGLTVLAWLGMALLALLLGVVFF